MGIKDISVQQKVSNSRMRLQKDSIPKIFLKQWRLFIFLAPALICFFVFNYLPMIGIVVAFQEYDPFLGFFKSPFVGFKWFGELFTSNDFMHVTIYTLTMSVAKLIFEFSPPIILALLLNELVAKHLRRAVQTISYLPHFISWVIAAVIVYRILDQNDGILNNLLAMFHISRYSFMGDSNIFIPITILSDIWKEVGWGTIYYLAALTAIDVSLYESASADGAGRLRQIWNITIPGIMPTIIILLILNVGGIIGANFDQTFNLQNPMIAYDTDVINTYIYRRGLLGGAYSFSAAFGLAQGLVSFILIYLTNRVSKNLTSISIY